MSPQLALVGLMIIPPVACLAVVYGKFVRKITKQVQDSLASATHVAEERISNMRTVIAFSQENKELLTYEGKLKDILNISYAESKARAIFYAMVSDDI